MSRRRANPTRFLVGFLVFVVALLGIATNKEKQAETLPRAAWGDKTPLGGQGLRLMLQKLGYSPQLQRDSLQTMPPDAKIWLILDPETRFSAREAQLLLDWVEKGGVLLFCVRPDASIFGISVPEMDSGEQSEGIERLRNALGIARSSGQQPKAGEFLPDLTPLSLDTTSNYRAGVKSASGSARRMELGKPYFEIAGPPSGIIARRDVGRGHVFAFPDALLFTNYALSKDDNANLVANFLRVHAANGAVYFDERSGGKAAPNTAPPTLWTYLLRPPASYALWQLGIAGVLFWAFVGRRLGAPVALAPSEKVTRASQFTGAMGALFAKVERPQAAALIVGARFRKKLAQRLGLSPSETDAVLARRAQEIGGIPFEITDRLLLQSRAPAQTAGEALRDAQEMERVLQRLEGRQ